VSATLEQSILAMGDGSQNRVLVLSHELHRNPEIAWEEYESAARVAAELDDAGFTVEPDYVGLSTAFRAHLGSGPLHVALCAEYDALPAAIMHPGPVAVARADPTPYRTATSPSTARPRMRRHTPTVASTPPTPSPSPRWRSGFSANNSRPTFGFTA
jgi:hypothetical protein